MDVQAISSSQKIGSRPLFPWISWGAIFGGLAGGMATYMLLALLGLAAGLTAINPQEGAPPSGIPIATGIWTGISMLLSAFVGGYVASRLSGLSRMSDGIFHGFVAWGVSTLLFAYLLTTAVGSVLGGAFSFIGKGIQGAATGAASGGTTLLGSPDLQNQLESIVKGGSSEGSVDPSSLKSLQDRLAAGDRNGAMQILTGTMGFSTDRANQVVDQGIALFGVSERLPQQAREVASKTVTGLTMASWWLFVGVLLSMALGIWGGALGARATSRRRNPELVST
jgi:hypothetical protein